MSRQVALRLITNSKVYDCRIVVHIKIHIGQVPIVLTVHYSPIMDTFPDSVITFYSLALLPSIHCCILRQIIALKLSIIGIKSSALPRTLFTNNGQFLGHYLNPN